jgi:endonuclease/exonuclease/phosphatase family metal-dependent hydrolase
MTRHVSVLLRMVAALCIIAFGASQARSQAPDTLRIATYNILYFSGSTGPERVPEFRKVVRAMDPDILVVQEMSNQTGVDIFLSDILEVIEPQSWEVVPFRDAPNSENACFYRTEAVEFVSTRYIPTQLRDIDEYILRMPYDTTAILRIYSAHLKASQGSDNEQRRLAEATILRNYLNELPDGSDFLTLGDFNVYRSSEPAYQMLIGEPDNVGRSFDPIDTPGEWHNDVAFAPIHTHATRYESGGLDDRFDFILASRSMFDTVGFQYLEGSHTAFGNDGNHFNESINYGDNSAVPDSIADALYNASDHLPVFLSLLFHSSGSVSETPQALLPQFQLYPNWPNPFNSQTLIRYEVAAPGPVRLQVYDLLGRRVATLAESFQSPGTHTVAFVARGLASGTYFYSLETAQTVQTRSMLLVK